MTNRSRYDLYLNTPEFHFVKVAESVLVEEDGLLVRFGFRYTPDYLANTSAFPLDPVRLPLSTKEYVLECRLGVPGILDDYLPDDWGRKVLARLVFYRDQRALNSHSCIDTLSVLGESRIGALQWVAKGQAPNDQSGCDIEKIKLAEKAAQSIDQPERYPDQTDELSLLYLANAGTGVGGARPKALISDRDKYYLAKFNRLTQDPYNNARVELACLEMASLAGLEVFSGHVIEGINGREVLLLKRFDVISDDKEDYRKHLITVNALLKEKTNQRDRGGIFRYDDIVQLVRQHSIEIERDLLHLLRMMLFNRCINNTDTHERNFSFIHTGEGYRLAPAYDMVPSLVTGQYPVAGFGYSQQPPLCSEVKTMGKVFGLPKTKVNAVADEVMSAVEAWVDIAQKAGVSDQDILAIEKRISF